MLEQPVRQLVFSGDVCRPRQELRQHSGRMWWDAHLRNVLFGPGLLKQRMYDERWNVHPGY
jgi:hypothetical protein